MRVLSSSIPSISSSSSSSDSSIFLLVVAIGDIIGAKCIATAVDPGLASKAALRSLSISVSISDSYPDGHSLLLITLPPSGTLMRSVHATKKTLIIAIPYINPPAASVSTDPSIGPNISPNEKPDANRALAPLLISSWYCLEYIVLIYWIRATTPVLIQSAPANPLITVPIINGIRLSGTPTTWILPIRKSPTTPIRMEENTINL